MWLTERKNPRTNFFFSAFCRTLLLKIKTFFGACSADCFLGHVLQMWQQVAV